MYICIYVYMYICIYVYMYICIYVYVYAYVCMHASRGKGWRATPCFCCATDGHSGGSESVKHLQQRKRLNCPCCRVDGSPCSHRSTHSSVFRCSTFGPSCPSCFTPLHFAMFNDISIQLTKLSFAAAALLA